MTSLVEIRRKYPQYGDLSDEQLTDALHAKHYGDIDKADFRKRIGFNPPRKAGEELKSGLDKAGATLRKAPGNMAYQAMAGLDLLEGATKALGTVAGDVYHGVTGGKSMTGKGNAPMETKVVNGKKVYRWNGEGEWKSPPAGFETWDAKRRNAYLEADRPMMTRRSTEDQVGDPLAAFATMFVPGGKEKTAAKGILSGAERAAAGAERAGLLAKNAGRLEKAGVTPYLAIADEGKGKTSATNAIAENFLAGGKVRSRLRQSVDEVEQGTGILAQKFGQARGRQISGEQVQQGVERFANGRARPPASVAAPAKETSFSAKSKTVYDKAFAPILDAEANAITANANRAEASKLMGLSAGQRPVAAITPQATMQTLGEITNRVNAPELSKVLSEGPFQRIAAAIGKDGADIRFTDLRGLRTWVREAQRNPELRASVGDANLQRLESSLTKDIYSSAEALGGAQAAQRLRRADDYYRAGSERIKTALQPFADAKSGENAYSRIMNMAGSGASADGRSLVSLKRSLNRDEWGDVAANVMADMGTATAGARGVEDSQFSISTFVTNYNKLSPKGKDVLFGSSGGGGAKATELRKSLDELAWAADQVKRVEKGANVSKSAVSGQSLATFAALANPGTTVPAAAGLSALFGAGELLTNPRAIRILTRGIRQQKAEAQIVKDLSNVIDITPYLKASVAPSLVEGQAAQLAPQVTRSAAQPQTTQEEPQGELRR